jgi:putative Mn2+ efflux pump MntP
MTGTVPRVKPMLRTLLFVVPLGLDTFAVSAALGLGGLSTRERLRLSVLMSVFEMTMPVVGLLLGRGLGQVIGGAAEYVAVAVLALLGAWVLLAGEEHEGERVDALSSGNVVAVVALGLSISVDELAMGFTIGLLRLSIWLAVLLIGVQAFLFAQIGLRVGARISEAVREGAERLAGVALLGLAALFLLERLL